MMKKHFCVSCGHEIQYREVRPNFCPECGTGQLSTAQRIPSPKAQTEPVYEEDDEPSDLDADKLVSLFTPRVNSYQGISAKSVIGTEEDKGEQNTGLNKTQLKAAQKRFKDFSKSATRVEVEID